MRKEPMPLWLSTADWGAAVAERDFISRRGPNAESVRTHVDASPSHRCGSQSRAPARVQPRLRAGGLRLNCKPGPGGPAD